MVKNLPYDAGDAGSIPGQGTKIPHAVGQLSLCAPQLESLHAANYRAHTLWNLRAITTEPMCPGACTPKLERSLRAATKDPACLNEDPSCHN